MKCAARVALGIAGGYFLGRTKKLKLALMLGGMAAGRRGGAGELLSQGSKLLKNSPELAKLTDELRGRLIDAAKGAAVSVATRQVESLADRVSSTVEGLATARPKVPKVPDIGQRDDAENVEPGDEATEDDRAGEDSSESAAEKPAREAPQRTSTPSRGRTGGTATRTRTPSSARGTGRTAAAKVPRPTRPRRGDSNG